MQVLKITIFYFLVAIHHKHIFFSKSKIQTNFDLFDYSKIEIQFQNVSNDKYLKTFDINSPIINSNSTLNSKIEFEGSKDDFEFFINTEVYEDLTKENDSDKYEFIFPNFNLSKVLRNWVKWYYGNSKLWL